ncbi:MAG: hypothetical protein OJF49_004149 [Ktedonobacterales bacterium]|nr:MAG: hypothetical protein OJF49_004149 [Ktedonobacterales bacterium]
MCRSVSRSASRQRPRVFAFPAFSVSPVFCYLSYPALLVCLSKFVKLC